MFADLASIRPRICPKRLAAIALASAANPRPLSQRSTNPPVQGKNRPRQ